ncbi:MAG: FMN-binding negative transcriptional regulator [Bosea sp.]|uniref:FMN-binding negative transcriptional regulator n=1 Tax=unclassified Bosea (in: a-proteobacteria) TaxID=2653178 RepID=UPI0009675A44|nr:MULTISPECIES: FMN-binding negative transcriptional regulator [unclassified Bosea (in: a-proteobacteria)]MBN9456451.1 FMN-binding negative transcriptional regulator [Bosea sp. (in: a-proteobacteria)]OJV08705.1 MAG: transcriptional regulator [Bosea sp. 67-29]
MYEPSHFKVEDRAQLHAVIRQHPLATLVTAGEGGLMANPVPFVLHADEGEQGLLRAHLARPNAQWKAIAAGAETLVIFTGVERYVTPAWYATKRESGKVVPTWNYVTVQVRGPARTIEDQTWLRAQLESLTRQQEAPRAEPWAVADAPEPFIAAQARGIVGIEIAIASIVGKFKLSQNRREDDKLGVLNGLSADPESGSQAMAALVKEHGFGGSV